MKLFNDQLRPGRYLQPSQLQDDLQIVSRTINNIEEQIGALQESVLDTPNQESLDKVKSELIDEIDNIKEYIESIILRLEKIENKKPWWVRFWKFLFK